MHLHSYSFELNPDWSKWYGAGQEICIQRAPWRVQPAVSRGIGAAKAVSGRALWRDARNRPSLGADAEFGIEVH